MLLCCDNKLKDGSKKEGKFLLTEPWLRPPAEEPLALQSHSRLITQRSFIQQLHFKSLGLEFRRESIGFWSDWLHLLWFDWIWFWIWRQFLWFCLDSSVSFVTIFVGFVIFVDLLGFLSDQFLFRFSSLLLSCCCQVAVRKNGIQWAGEFCCRLWLFPCWKRFFRISFFGMFHFQIKLMHWED